MMQVQLKPSEQQDYLNKHGHFEGLAKKLKTNLTTGKWFILEINSKSKSKF